jgi:hypothetical protein
LLLLLLLLGRRLVEPPWLLLLFLLVWQWLSTIWRNTLSWMLLLLLQCGTTLKRGTLWFCQWSYFVIFLCFFICCVWRDDGLFIFPFHVWFRNMFLLHWF